MRASLGPQSYTEGDTKTRVPGRHWFRAKPLTWKRFTWNCTTKPHITACRVSKEDMLQTTEFINAINWARRLTAIVQRLRKRSDSLYWCPLGQRTQKSRSQPLMRTQKTKRPFLLLLLLSFFLSFFLSLSKWGAKQLSWYSVVGIARCYTDTGSVPRCGMRFFFPPRVKF